METGTASKRHQPDQRAEHILYVLPFVSGQKKKISVESQFLKIGLIFQKNVANCVCIFMKDDKYNLQENLR